MGPPRVIVIGAGPAGCAAAIGLAQRGVEVTLVESREFPRRKVCGEFLSPAALALLGELLPVGAVPRAGAQRVETLTIEHGDRAVGWTLPTPAWALSRATLDQLLLEQARRAGARVRQPMRVRSVEYRRDGVAAELAGGEVLTADVVVHADGTGRLDRDGEAITPCRPGVVAHKCHLRVPGGVDGVRMRSAAGAYVGVVEVEQGLATCALVARAELIRAQRGDPDAMLRALWPGFDPAWRDGAWMACGVPASGYIRPGHVRSFRVGNAAAAVEPVGGEGIGLALWAGATLAKLFPVQSPTPAALAQAQRAFAAAYRRRLRVRRPACRAAAAALMRPMVARLAWPALRAPGLTLAPWYALTGKVSRPVRV